MSMTLTVPDEIALSAQEIAASTGDSAEHLLLQVLQRHFPPIPISPELQAEFDAWEKISNEFYAAIRGRRRRGLGMKRGEIWTVALPATTGHEQSGQRPCLVIQDALYGQRSPLVLVVPLTSQLGTLRFPGTVQIEPTPQNGLS